MSEEEAKIVRKIKVKDSTKSKAAKAKPKKAPKLKKEKRDKTAKENYFVGAWRELRQVHWTNRRSTWKLTLAVLLFSLFFIAIVLICDYFFNNLMQALIS